MFRVSVLCPLPGGYEEPETLQSEIKSEIPEVLTGNNGAAISSRGTMAMRTFIQPQQTEGFSALSNSARRKVQREGPKAASGKLRRNG